MKVSANPLNQLQRSLGGLDPELADAIIDKSVKESCLRQAKKDHHSSAELVIVSKVTIVAPFTLGLTFSDGSYVKRDMRRYVEGMNGMYLKAEQGLGDRHVVRWD
jgi:hypothetical protein